VVLFSLTFLFSLILPLSIYLSLFCVRGQSISLIFFYLFTNSNDRAKSNSYAILLLNRLDIYFKFLKNVYKVINIERVLFFKKNLIIIIFSFVLYQLL
jgi:hypothetical protein